MTFQQQLARLEQQLYEQEHQARLGLGRLDDTYLNRQARRREMSLAWMQEMRANIRRLERELAALRGAGPREVEHGYAAGVILTEKGFEEKG